MSELPPGVTLEETWLIEATTRPTRPRPAGLFAPSISAGSSTCARRE